MTEARLEGVEPRTGGDGTILPLGATARRSLAIPRSTFWGAWGLLALLLPWAALAHFPAWPVWGGLAHGPVVGLAAVALLVAAAGQVTAARFRARLHRLAARRRLSPVWVGGLWWVAVLVLWAVFWGLDLRRARYQLVLTCVPTFGAAFALALVVGDRIAARRPWVRRWAAALGVAAYALPFAMRWLADAPTFGSVEVLSAAAACVWTAALGLAWLRPRVAPSPSPSPQPSRPARAPLPLAAAGAMLGLGEVWVTMLWRSDNGCTGVSSSYHATLIGTTLALFALGPAVLARLVGDDETSGRQGT